ncbi:MAG: PTS sugar transporter subunit IIA [Candidatus Zixiibacteriota bacterium]
MIQLSGLLQKKLFRIDQHPDNKLELFDILLDIIEKTGKVKDADQLRSDLLLRENIQSTGLGYGLALPHVASNGIDNIALCCAICPNGVDYNAIDDKPVHIAFLIAQPEHGKTREYLHVLASLSRLFRGTELLDMLLKLKSRDEVYDIIHTIAKEKGY